jgi:hypothetical protein
MTWPPTLDELKDDLKIAHDDTRDDTVLQRQLDASVEFVQRVRRSSFNFEDDPQSLLPAPSADLWLGTVRLAGRWFTRRRSPDALIAMADSASSRVPSFDPDIDRQLGIGRFRGPVFA